jgi:hypothetical protein
MSVSTRAYILPSSTPEVAHSAAARQLCSEPPAEATTRALSVPGGNSWSARRISSARKTSVFSAVALMPREAVSACSRVSRACMGR